MSPDNDKNEQPPKRPLDGPPRGNRFALILFIALMGAFSVFFLTDQKSSVNEISYSAFLSYLEQGTVEAVKIVDQTEIEGKLRGKTGNTALFRTRIPYTDLDLVKTLRESGVSIEGAVRGVSVLQVLLETLPWIFGFFLIWMMLRQFQGNNKAFSFGKSRAKRYLDASKKTTFEDVAGQKEAKYELTEVVDYLKNPQKFVKMGARIPKGVLLVGMPGTGKTLLAKAVAGEANVPFFHMSGSDFVEMFVGVGASRVRDLFEQGRKSAPCILFIDELDAVGRTRGAGYGGGHDEREQTLNQMLVEMDGFDTKDGVIILAATNRPDVLDPALLRPGRFDRQVVVAMPDVQEREQILAIHMNKIPVETGTDVKRLARATPGTSGADLANLVNEAALFAVRRNKSVVGMEDFEDARDKILMGIARSSLFLTEEEKLATAYHEAGHALVHYYLDHTDPLHKVTIVPRGRALGLALSLPEKDTYSHSVARLKDRIVVCYGGFAAESIVYGETTTGTAQDLRQATDIARKMVCEWGMSPKMGAVAYGQEDEPIFLGKEIARHKDYSEETARNIDASVRSILDEGRDRALSILTDHKDQLETLARELIQKETLQDDAIRVLLGFPAREIKE
ncbi:MAG TPA: ATP-dependent zinc metalloprotease FtsH [Spirochaetales bacterium]|nr:ATP-dependent zinc metalloprotease FtsH [Spirochaetales bacterium]